MSTPKAQAFVCIHGHFYQPPRENPWLDAVEVQDSAAPWHDWNERITVEAYAPNAAARLLDGHGRIVALRNNYNRISFNIGPTLLSWMERAQPSLYAQILLADQESTRAVGRGNAIAQAYGHCIMPLADRRDQRTQVRWGIADFVHRFGRLPDGMWLPETAADLATLTTLAEHGIRYTILAPGQARRVRHGDGPWHEVAETPLDCTRPYRCALAGGRSITVFFYDGDIAHGIAFAGLLNDGRELARRLAAAAADRPGTPLVHVATDGESYGHHHRYGEMALAAALETLEREGQVAVTNYAAYLDHVPVRDDVEIRENSSWSCAHGVERWRAHCGCNAGHPDWSQAWRTPLRAAMDWLKGQLDALYERHAEPLLRDPWGARDAYAMVILQRTRERQDAYLERQARRHLAPTDQSRAWRLLEMQRHALLCFTSCGWFFDEPSGLETVQVLTYAGRAMQLARELGAQLEPEFVRRLQLVRSNVPVFTDGRQIYRDLVRPLVADPARVLAHTAMCEIVEPARATTTRAYGYEVTTLGRLAEHAGSASFAAGHALVRTDATDDTHDYVYAVLHMGGHDMHCAVAPASPALQHTELQETLRGLFLTEPLSELVRRMDRDLGGTFFSLRDAFTDDRRRILEHVTAQVTAACTTDYERIVSDNRRLLDFLMQSHSPLPEALRVAVGFVVQRRLEHALSRFVTGETDLAPARQARADARRWGVGPSLQVLQTMIEDALVSTVSALDDTEPDVAVARAHRLLDAAADLEIPVDTWQAQNRYYVLLATHGRARWPAAVFGQIRRLGERLDFHLPEWEPTRPATA